MPFRQVSACCARAGDSEVFSTPFFPCFVEDEDGLGDGSGAAGAERHVLQDAPALCEFGGAFADCADAAQEPVVGPGVHRQGSGDVRMRAERGVHADAGALAGATVRTPYYGHRDLPEHYQQYNRNHARLRAPDERVFTRLKSWRPLRRTRSSTRRISRTVQAVHTLLTCDY